MASASLLGFSRTSLHTLSGYIGAKGDDNKPMKQAFYSTAATLFVAFAGAVAISVFYILQAFIRPLLWAVLCGTFLHPFKRTLTSVLRGWLKNLRISGTPLAVGTLLIPWNIIGNLTENLWTFLISNVRLILGGTIGLPAAYIMYHFGPVQQMCTYLTAFLVFLYDALGYFNAFWVWSLVLAYGLVVLFFWSPQSSVILRLLSIPVWLAIVFHLVTIAGPLRVPLLLLVVIMIIAGFVSEVHEARRKAGLGQDVASPSVRVMWNVWASANKLCSTKDIEVAPSDSDVSTDAGQEECADDNPVGGSTSLPDQVTNSEEKEAVDTEESKVEQRPKELHVPSEPSTSSEPHVEDVPAAPERSVLDMCFIALIWALILVRIWIHIWVLNFLPILFLCLIIKKFGNRLSSMKWLQEHISSVANRATAAVTSDDRVNILAPRPIRGIGKLMLRGDKKIIRTMENSLDQTVTILIVLLLLVGSIVGTLFVLVQVHKESMYIVSLSSNVLNQTMQPEYMQWLPDQDEMQSTIDSVVSNAYLYGREWITDKLNGAIDGDDLKRSKVEKEVLQVWDRLYEKLSSKNNSNQPERHLLSRQTTFDLSNMSSVWDLVNFSQNFNLDFVGLAKENVGILMQVVDSLWSVLRGNISLIMTVLKATLSILFGGGTALLNFFLSAIVFLTTLFYLLASSGDRYMPMEWFSKLSPTQGSRDNKIGVAVEQAISSVFMASLKMAVFYGLYTWLTHSVFDVQIVFIPSALAAIFAAIPFLGTYFAAVPAVIELWLVKGQHIRAILMFVCHLLPMFYVDTAIYSEMKGGHPYLTGLAIAGGIYWLGLEGAIIAPILLCCLIVAMNVYSSMLQPDVLQPTTISDVGSQRGKKVSFNMKSQEQK